jgi:uncharacterized membrane protein HdeD (DUF308 family)
MDDTRGAGWVLFAGIMIMIAGILNVFWGIEALDDSTFFHGRTQYFFENLHTWGWVTLILGVLQILAALSIWRGGVFGQFFGIFAASLSAIGALFTVGGYPFWSLAIFAIDVLIIYGLAAYGGNPDGADAT